VKTIDYRDWLERSKEGVRTIRLILSHFDLTRLRRRKRPPGRVRGNGSRKNGRTR